MGHYIRNSDRDPFDPTRTYGEASAVRAAKAEARRKREEDAFKRHPVFWSVFMVAVIALAMILWAAAGGF